MSTRPSKKSTLFLCLLLVIIINTSCVLKVGNYSLSETTKKRLGQTSALHNIEDDRFSIGVDLFTPRFFYNKMDISLSWGYSEFPEKGPVTTIKGETLPHPTTDFMYLSMGPRIYPFGSGAIVPVVGGGIGYYIYSRWYTTLIPSYSGYDVYQEKLGIDIIASGFRPYVTVGVYLFPLKIPKKGIGLLLFGEYRYNFVNNLNAYDGKLDIAGNQLMFGIGFFLAARYHFR